METKEILKELEREYKPAKVEQQVEKAKADKFNAVSKFIIIIYFNCFSSI